MIRRFAVLAVLAMVLPAAQADTVRLKTGGTIDGIVTEEGSAYVIEVQFGTMRVDKALVDSIERKETPLGEHRKRAAAIAIDDADGWWKLGQWARRNDLDLLAEDDFKYLIGLQPDHEAARAALGYERVNGDWLTHDEAMAAKGMVRVSGKWVAKEAAQLMKALAEANALEAKARDAEVQALAEEARAKREVARAEQEERRADLQVRASRRRSFYGYGYGRVSYSPWTNHLHYNNGGHGGTPYFAPADGHAVSIDVSNGEDLWVHHSGGGMDQHTVIHRSSDGHQVTEQIVNGQQQLGHRASSTAPTDLTMQHR